MKTKLGFVVLVVMLLAAVPAAVGADRAPGVIQQTGSVEQTGIPRVLGQPYVEPKVQKTYIALEADPGSTKVAPDGRAQPAAPDEIKPEVAPEAEGVSVIPWRLLLGEGFEGAWPWGLWSTWDNNGATGGSVCWDDDDWAAKPGRWSAWPANGCANGLDPAFWFYPNQMDSWMRWGPFNLAGYWQARLNFNWWNQSEINFDWFWWCASHDGWNFTCSRMSGQNSAWPPQDRTHWRNKILNLPGYVGDPSVWFAFIFTSDINVVDDGPLVDRVWIQVKP